MASWAEVRKESPELAAAVQARFEAHGLAYMATLRRDGSPRISGIESQFGEEVWLGMMPGSRKVADLLGDPRLALHSANVDKDVAEGDAKISGRAELLDESSLEAFKAHVRSGGGAVPDGSFPLFRVDVGEVSFLRPAGDHLVIEWWREGDGLHRVERR